MKKLKQSIYRILGNLILKYSLDLLCKSLKIEIINKDVIENLEKQNQNYVLAFWHGTMLLPWFLHRNKNFSALTSMSKDGDLLAKLLRFWNYEVIRGSSSKGGDVALGIMIDYAKNKYSIAITPDGPTGPPLKFKAGAVITAKKSKIPLVLAGVGYLKKKKLKSWDSFQIPLPFSKARIIYSDPIIIDSELDYNQTDEIIKSCEKIMNELQLEAEKF
ncbi:MAG: lysophospholipid acyltransferase family protein [Ignavibacterium sp.]|nr:lysophospholipid acyltransferase family protein [Ignavibacterium sp.]